MILDKLEQLKKRFLDGRDDATFQIKLWEDEINESFLLDDLSKHDGVRLVREKIKDILEVFDDSLRDSETSEKERGRIFAERNVYQWFDELFLRASISLESKEKQIDNELKL